MLNKIFISHWKIALIVSTIGLISLAIVTALYWTPALPRLVETQIPLEHLLKKQSADSNK